MTATSIVWTPNGTIPNTGCFITGGSTNLAYSGGVVGAGVSGDIRNLTAGDPFPILDFMSIPAHVPGPVVLSFDLSALGPGVANTNCAGLLVGETCSPFAGSPFVLQLLAGNQTGVTLTAAGTVLDAGVLSNWIGSYHTTLSTQTPGQVQAIIGAGGSVASTYGGDFTLTVIPELGSVSMTLLGLSLVALGRYRRWK
ncbi:MAG: hypothetical protein HY820_05495 [Acidobacteria bacterium]|nr:hypothetical protein [Acidobacteriota bacterium]